MLWIRTIDFVCDEVGESSGHMPRLIQGRALHTALGKVNRQEYGNQGGGEP